MNIREVKKEDMVWINSQYREIGFKESDFESEFIAIAEVDKQPVAIGRVQYIDDLNAELGGIYVLEKFRGQSIAKKVVLYLIDNSKKYKTIYCLPFSHLRAFYEGLGFKDVVDRTSVPKKVLEKHSWCLKTYESKTLLFNREINND